MNQMQKPEVIEVVASEYSAPAVISSVKVTDVVRGGSGLASDNGNFLPL